MQPRESIQINLESRSRVSRETAARYPRLAVVADRQPSPVPRGGSRNKQPGKRRVRERLHRVRDRVQASVRAVAAMSGGSAREVATRAHRCSGNLSRACARCRLAPRAAPGPVGPDYDGSGNCRGMSDGNGRPDFFRLQDPGSMVTRTHPARRGDGVPRLSRRKAAIRRAARCRADDRSRAPGSNPIH